MRLFLALAALALVTAGCGGMTGAGSGPPDGELMAAPAIEAANRPAPEVRAALLAAMTPFPDPADDAPRQVGDAVIGMWNVGSATVCFFPEDGFPPPPARGTLEDEDCTRATEAANDEARARLPREGSKPAVSASLAGTNGDPYELATWRDTKDRLCAGLVGKFRATLKAALGLDGPRSAMFTSSCAGDEGCGEICITLPGSALVPAPKVLGGLVRADGEYLRVTVGDGRQLVYPLGGPSVDDGTYRAFIAELPAHKVVAAELFTDGRLVGEVR